MHRMFKLARFFSVAALLTALLSSCFGPSIYFTSKVAPDTAVTIVTEKFIPYGNDDYQIDEVVLPNGDLVIARSLQEDTAVVERFDNDTLRVMWERKIYLGEHQVWSPQMKYDETDGTIAIIARKKWDGGDSVGLQGLEIDANTGAIRQERWLAKHYSTNDSIDTRSGYQYDYSEDNSKFLYFYLDYTKITETDDDVPKTLDVNFEVFDLKFKKLGGGKITRQLPQEVDDEREEIGKYFRGVIVDNNGDVYTVNLAIPGRIEVTKHWIGSGTQKTLEAKWDDVNILEDDKTFGGMAFESDNIDNLYLAAPFRIDRGVSGGIVLAKYNFNTQQVPVLTRFNFTPQQTEMMVGDDELKNFYVNAVTLHNGTAIVHFENDNSGWVKTKNGSYYQWESNDLILLGFDLTGKPLYQTVLNKKQASIPNMGNGGYEVGYAYLKSHDGLRFYYIDRQNEGLVTRFLDTKTGSLSNPKGVLSLGFNASFVKHATDYNSKSDCWYFCLHKGIGAENAYIYKVKMDENHMRNLIQSR